MVAIKPVKYVDFLTRHLLRFNGNKMGKTRMEKLIMEEWGSDPRTIRSKLAAMETLQLIMDGGGHWIIPAMTMHELELAYAERIGENSD